MVRVWWPSVLAVCVCLFAQTAAAEVRALLIGVSDYDNSIGMADLKGPAHDVRFLQEVMRGRGVRDISILADGVEGGGVPTRAAIIKGFAALAARSVPGDLVFISMSGHGTRQPDQDGDETDGLDEVFLPADTGRAEPGAGLIPNALVDDDIGRMVRAIRETGADVWLVMDSCHSGSGLRAAPDGTAARYVDPALLGVSASASRVTEADTVEEDGPEPPGGYLAFYAARSSEVAREVSFATDEGEVWYGLFTAKLAARLQDAGAISYRQLFQGVLADMNDTTVPGGARLQTPLWAGTLIDATVLGGRDTAGLRRFAVQGNRLRAGRVHGLADGTVMGLVADPADPADALIGTAQVQKSTATTARLVPVAADCVPQAALPCPDSGSLPPGARYAQVLARPVDLVVRLAPPRGMDGLALAPGDPAAVALEAAVAAVNADGGTRVEYDATAYDVESVLAEGALWFGPRAQIGGSPVGLQVAPEVAALTAALRRIRKAEELSRLLSSVATKPSLLSPNPVNIRIDVAAADARALAPVDAGVDPYEECGVAMEGAAAPVALAPSADLKQCDALTVSAQGATAGARDVNRIHIDAKYCVNTAYERIEDTARPRAVGDGMILCSDCPEGYAAGEERLFLVVTEAEANAEALNLEGMIETCAGAPTRGAAEGQVIDFLTGLAQRPGTRGAFGARAAASEVWVERHDWRVLPKPEAFARAGIAK
ncbi:caspase domain-containing protein [Seohaeicola nanhaiensis]|uniref:Caspase domain-containing protein n=1 Tax=Seohaeicola nanhaiensis TaxID=1387282 RepID=A0ABV9KJM0_9RHOB